MKLDKEEQIVFEFTRQDLPGAYQEDLAWKIPCTEEPGRLHAVHGVAKSQTRLNDFTFTFHFHALEKEMATHSTERQFMFRKELILIFLMNMAFLSLAISKDQ